MRIAVVGVGALGARAARQLVSTPGVTGLVLADPDTAKCTAVAEVLGPIASVASGTPDGTIPDEIAGCDAALLAGPAEVQPDQVRRLLAYRRPVVCTADSLDAVGELLALDDEAIAADVPVVAGAAFSPGLSCLLAGHGARWFDVVSEIHVAWLGTGGPACAHQHHRTFAGRATEWIDGRWMNRPSGSGRELCFFPDPVGGADCYRGALCEPLLLQPVFPDAARITARMAGTRRDRLLARLPMLRPPHPEGAVGAIRVELRGRHDGGTRTVVLGAMDRPAVAGAAVAAVAAARIGRGEGTRAGVASVSGHFDPLGFLTELAHRGVRAALFEGAAPAA